MSVRLRELRAGFCTMYTSFGIGIFLAWDQQVPLTGADRPEAVNNQSTPLALRGGGLREPVPFVLAGRREASESQF